MAELDEHVLEDLYTWIDQIPLSRPKRDLKRDFSDGVLVAEVVKHFLPQCVELHNYSAALAVNKKLVNWHILNRKVFKKMGFEVNEDVIKNVVNCQPFAVEQLLLLLRRKIEQSSGRRAKSDDPEVDQDEIVYGPDPSPPNAASVQPVTTFQRDKTTGANKSSAGINGISGDSGAAPGGRTMPQKNTGGSHTQGYILARQLLEEKDEQLKAKDETIEILQGKIRRLEQLLQLKDIRIEDLQTRLSELKDEGQSTITKPAPVLKGIMK